MAGVTGYAAVVLAGGEGRRLGGSEKPTVRVGGRSMLGTVLAAVADAVPRVVVGPPALATGLASGIVLVREEPPGGGPVAAAAAGLDAVLAPGRPGAAPAPAVPQGAAGPPLVALLAADLPFLTAAAIGVLRTAAMGSTVDLAMFVDDAGRRQLLCAVWRTGALRDRLAALGGSPMTRHPSGGARPDATAVPVPRLAGLSVRRMVEGLAVAEIGWGDPGPPPWYDCDTEADLSRAREWT
jgi:molybdopterin-guanine dinucleotide biosynthesis protein A